MVWLQQENSWDQIKHCIKPCRLVSLLQQPHKSHVPPRNYSGIKMASNKVSCNWLNVKYEKKKRVKYEKKTLKRGKSWQKSCGKLLQQMCLASLWAIFPNLRWNCQWLPQVTCSLLALWWEHTHHKWPPLQNEVRRNNFIFINPKTCTRWFILMATNP